MEENIGAFKTDSVEMEQQVIRESNEVGKTQMKLEQNKEGQVDNTNLISKEEGKEVEGNIQGNIKDQQVILQENMVQDKGLNNIEGQLIPNIKEKHISENQIENKGQNIVEAKKIQVKEEKTLQTKIITPQEEYIVKASTIQEKNKENMGIQKKIISSQYYSKTDFWDIRYSENSGFYDWYAEFAELKHALQIQYHCRYSDRILMVGCGNSRMSIQMFEAGYNNIVNIDISESCITQMKQKFPKMSWYVMDATKMTFPDAYFDVVIDKGTMDALISGNDLSICQKLLSECMRVTKKAGQVIQVTYGSPDGRKRVYKNALPFHLYDYYFALANLSDLSTMVNIMRNNFPGRPMSQIMKDTQLMKQSLSQFSLVKLLRTKRKKEKQYIIWKEDPKERETEKQLQIEEKQKNTQVQIQPTYKKIQDQTRQLFSHKPQKQSYVYVYSIKRKLTFGIQKILAQFKGKQLHNQIGASVYEQQILIKGVNRPNQINLLSDEKANQSIFQAVAFLIKSKIPFCGLTIFNNVHSFQQHLTKESSLKSLNLVFEHSDNYRYQILQKTIIHLEIELCELSCFKLEDILIRLIDTLTQKLNLHPTPKEYALLCVLKDRLNMSVKKILTKYWYPTFKINQFLGTRARCKVSLPPSHKTDKCYNLILQTLQSLKLKCQATLQVKGGLYYPDLEAMKIINMAALSNQGMSVQYGIFDFELGFKPKDLQNVGTKVQVKNIQTTIVHLLALY